MTHISPVDSWGRSPSKQGVLGFCHLILALARGHIWSCLSHILVWSIITNLGSEESVFFRGRNCGCVSSVCCLTSHSHTGVLSLEPNTGAGGRILISGSDLMICEKSYQGFGISVGWGLGSEKGSLDWFGRNMIQQVVFLR